MRSKDLKLYRICFMQIVAVPRNLVEAFQWPFLYHRRIICLDELENHICCPSLSSSSVQNWATDVLFVIINFVQLCVVFDELSVQTDNRSVARFYTCKFDR